MIRLDTVKLEIPFHAVKSINHEHFVEKQTKGRYDIEKARKPYGFNSVYTIGNSLYIEHSAKVLRDDYLQSINLNNFDAAFDLLKPSIDIDKDVAFNQSKVHKVDVTDNIDISNYPLTKTAIIDVLRLLHSNTDFVLSKHRYGVDFKAKYKTVRERLSAYSKYDDLMPNTKNNKLFKQTLKNEGKLLNDSFNILRIETNHAKHEKIRERLSIPNVYYATVLNSKENVNYNTLKKICNPKTKNINNLVSKVSSRKLNKIEIRGYIDLFNECDFDLHLVKDKIRAELNLTTKNFNAYHWKNKGIEQLYFDTLVKRDNTESTITYDVFNMILSDLRKVA